MKTSKDKIKTALQRFTDGNLAENARHLLNVLGYHSQRIMDLEPNTAEEFLSAFNLDNKINEKLALLQEWESVDLLFQLTGEQISDNGQVDIDFREVDIDRERDKSYLFFALKLCQSHYTRTQLAQITREINKPFKMPVMILFQHGDTLTFAVIDSRLDKRKKDEFVLEKTTLIKDINFADPHRAHIDILFDLSIAALYERHKFKNFRQLHEAWKKTLDTSELNKRFFTEIANWYFWGVNQVTFPEDAGKDVEVRNATSVIRLITRLIFVWFIKEKGLVSNDLFDHEKIREILINTDPQESTYYKAILQNLFFATLNQEMNTQQKPNNRKFRNRAKQSGNRDQNYMAHSLYRYEEYFKDNERALDIFGGIPFLNGGLFECLDKEDKDDPKKVLRVDGFSDHRKNPVNVPNFLFFSDEQSVDLNTAYGTRGRGYKVRGLIDILDSYKFTIAENTPIEEEVALDPELLGKVFENLLAAYNPETGASARKQSGSYYTPREIVNYMTDESLIAYLKHKCIAYHESQTAPSPTAPPAQLDLSGRAEPVQTQIDTRGVTLSDEQKDRIEATLRNLLAYNDEPHRFNDDETEALINAVDTLKILDPACGSGAFPMGVLHKLVFMLGKLDPRNQQWQQRQIDKVNRTIETAEKIDDSTVRENTIRDLEREIDNINEAFERNELDYGRKLYLIENCIYGVDIQPIAVQIAKLRFFISLVVNQKMDDSRENRGVRPLPNLETKFVAVNTLLSVEKPPQLPIRTPQIVRVEKELEEVRRRHFTARTPKTKGKYRELDTELRAELGGLLKDLGFPNETTEKVANWDPYDQNATADFFDSDWMFGVRDGFDVVIGNPPYVQLQKDGGRLGRLYAPCNFDSFIRTGDVYCLFYEKANKLLTNGGYVCFVTSNKWLRAGYGKKLRDYFIGHTQPVQLLDMGPDVFDATVDTNILLLRNAAPNAHTVFKAVTIESDFDKQSGDIAQYLYNNGVDMELPDKGEPWAVLSSSKIALKRKVEQVGRPLRDWNVGMYFGIKTGCNEAFIIDETKRNELLAEDPKSAEIIKPLLRGRDIKRYHAQWAGLYLLYIPWHFPLHEDSTISGASDEAEEEFKRLYPFIYNHLVQYHIRLSERNKSETGIRYEWYALQRCANTYYPEFSKEKIVWQEMARDGKFLIDKNKFNVLDTSRILTGNNLKYLTGHLNSKLFQFAFKNYYAGGHLGSKGIRFKSEFMKRFPVPPITEENQCLVAEIEEQVDKINAAKRSDANSDLTVFESEINQRVYLLSDLTPEEIAIVEENTV